MDYEFAFTIDNYSVTRVHYYFLGSFLYIITHRLDSPLPPISLIPLPLRQLDFFMSAFATRPRHCNSLRFPFSFSMAFHSRIREFFSSFFSHGLSTSRCSFSQFDRTYLRSLYTQHGHSVGYSIEAAGSEGAYVHVLTDFVDRVLGRCTNLSTSR